MFTKIVIQRLLVVGAVDQWFSEQYVTEIAALWEKAKVFLEEK